MEEGADPSTVDAPLVPVPSWEMVPRGGAGERSSPLQEQRRLPVRSSRGVQRFLASRPARQLVVGAGLALAAEAVRYLIERRGSPAIRPQDGPVVSISAVHLEIRFHADGER